MLVEVEGRTFSVDESTAYEGYWASVADGSWEPETLRLLVDRLGPGKRFVDVGAWVGPTTLLAAACGARVDAYEPDPVALEGLQRNLACNPELAERVVVHPYALGHRAGDADLAAPVMGTSVSSLVTTTGERRSVEVRPFAAECRLDTFAGADLVKVDIEGGEYLILRALGDYCRRTGVDLVLSVHIRFVHERVPSWLPRPLRLAALQVLALRQLRIAPVLRGYPSWQEAVDGGWARRRLLARLGRLVRFEDKEFFLSGIRRS